MDNRLHFVMKFQWEDPDHFLPVPVSSFGGRRELVLHRLSLEHGHAKHIKLGLSFRGRVNAGQLKSFLEGVVEDLDPIGEPELTDLDAKILLRFDPAFDPYGKRPGDFTIHLARAMVDRYLAFLQACGVTRTEVQYPSIVMGYFLGGSSPSDPHAVPLGKSLVDEMAGRRFSHHLQRS